MHLKQIKVPRTQTILVLKATPYISAQKEKGFVVIVAPICDCNLHLFIISNRCINFPAMQQQMSFPVDGLSFLKNLPKTLIKLFLLDASLESGLGCAI